MRADLEQALAASMPRAPLPVVLAESEHGPLRRLADALGETQVVIAGELARFAVARGVAAQGGRPILQLGRHVPAAMPGSGMLGLTTASDAAAAALREGWSVVRPSLPSDVSGLLKAAHGPVAVLLGPAAAVDEAVPAPARWAPRVWRKGNRATLVVSGAVIDVALPVARMLAGRGISVGVVEMPVLIGLAMQPLTAAEAIHVGPPNAADVLAEAAWPDGMSTVEVTGHTSRGLMEALLACIPLPVATADMEIPEGSPT